jgi:hypothetical protein
MASLFAAALLSSSAAANVLNFQNGAGTLDYGQPIVSSESLQAAVDPKKLLARAEALFEIAKSSEYVYGHPTRVIGSEGTFVLLVALIETRME